jgi:hypothetical protein
MSLHAQLTCDAVERNEEWRDQFQIFVAENYSPEQLVFVDETHLHRKVPVKGYGWGRYGDRACRREFFIWGKR